MMFNRDLSCLCTLLLSLSVSCSEPLAAAAVESSAPLALQTPAEYVLQLEELKIQFSVGPDDDPHWDGKFYPGAGQDPDGFAGFDVPLDIIRMVDGVIATPIKTNQTPWGTIATTVRERFAKACAASGMPYVLSEKPYATIGGPNWQGRNQTPDEASLAFQINDASNASAAKKKKYSVGDNKGEIWYWILLRPVKVLK